MQWVLTSCRAYSRSTKRASSFCARSIVALAAILICGATVFTSCTNDDNPTTPDLNLSEKIIGKWVPVDADGHPLLTNVKNVTTFLSATKATVSTSRSEYTSEAVRWNAYREYAVEIDGGKVILISMVNDFVKLVEEYDISYISSTEMRCDYKHTTFVNGNPVTVAVENGVRFVKTTADYRAAIVGTWQGRCTSEGSVFDDGQEHRWQYRADGTYVYYVKDGDSWVPYEGNTLNEYFVDGTLLCTRWIDQGQENREWWEITIAEGRMNWTALRANEDGTTFTATFEMTKVE